MAFCQPIKCLYIYGNQEKIGILNNNATFNENCYILNT